MTQEEKLDKVLGVLAKHYIEYKKVYDFYFTEDEIKKELKILLGQIVKDGFATVKEINDPEIHESYGFKIDVHRITNEGLEFFRTSSYKQKFKKELKKKYWSLVEKVSIAINAVLLLIIAIGGLYISKKANEDKEENKQLKRTVDSLTKATKNMIKDTGQSFNRSYEEKTLWKKDTMSSSN